MVEEDGGSGEDHADSERGGKNQGDHAVHDRLRVEQRVALPCRAFNGAKNCHGADAEDQRRGDEGRSHLAGAGSPDLALQPGPYPLEAALHADRFAEKRSESQADHQQKRLFPLERHAGAEHAGEDADRLNHRAVHRLGHLRQEHPEDAGGRNRQRIDYRTP